MFLATINDETDGAEPIFRHLRTDENLPEVPKSQLSEDVTGRRPTDETTDRVEPLFRQLKELPVYHSISGE